MQVNPSPWRQIFWTAVAGALVVLAPAVADQISNGVSGVADVSFWNVVVGAAVGAGIRAVIAFIPVNGGTPSRP